MEGERRWKQLALWRLMAMIAVLAGPMWMIALAHQYYTAVVGRVDQFRTAVQTGQATDSQGWIVAQIKEARERAATERNPTRAAAWVRQATLDDDILQSLRRRKPSDTEQAVEILAVLTLGHLKSKTHSV